MSTNRFFPQLTLMLLLPALLLLSACDRDDHDDDHFLSVDRVEIRDRDSGDLYAVWLSGTEAFDADAMPLIGVDEEVALDVFFYDFQNNQPHLGEEYFLDAWINSGASTDVVELDVQDDHVLVYGLGVGTTEIVFDLSHGNHSDFTSVPLQVSVDNTPTGGNPNVPN